jgi:hypothetical protein
MPQVRQFFVILLDEEDSRHTPNPFIKIRFHFGDVFVVDFYKSIYPKLFKIRRTESLDSPPAFSGIATPQAI